MTNLTKKIFITGATHGIGKATTELFCQKGWGVYGVSSVNDGRGEQMMRNLPSFHYFNVDIRDEDAIAELLSEIGHIDVAFNNAGIGKVPERADLENIDKAKEVIETNLLGTMICMKHEIRNMTEGCIINNASISAIKAATGADAAYSASKAGILCLTAEAACVRDYLPRIKFFSIMPGYIKTRMTATDDENKIITKLPQHKMGMPGDVALLVFKIVENNYAFTSGQCFNIDEGAFLV